MSSLLPICASRRHQRPAILRAVEGDVENTPQQRQQFMRRRHAVQPLSGGSLLRDADMAAAEDDHRTPLPAPLRFIVSQQDIVASGVSPAWRRTVRP